VRAELVRARAEASRVELAIQPVVGRAAVETQETQSVAPATPPVAPPVPQQVVSDPFAAAYRSVDEAAHLSQVLDALIDGVGAVFPRAALFVVKTKSKRLQGWRSVGFTGVAAITKEFEFSLATDSALTRAVNAGREVFTGGAPQDGEPTARPNEPREAWTVTFPVTTSDRVVAVVHADGGGRNGEEAREFDREVALDVSRNLIHRAGERLTVLMTSARTAFGNVIAETPATSITTAPPVKPVRQEEARLEAHGETADARRYASQLVSEISRYKQPAAPAEVPDRTLQERLASEIEGRRDQPAGHEQAGTALGVFDEALGKMLGNGDRDVPGQSEQPAAAKHPLLSGRT
jgi:hypothetical protein